MKKFFMELLTVLVIFSGTCCIFGCGVTKNSPKVIKFDEEWNETAIFECGEDVILPSAFVEDNKGNKLSNEVKYVFISPQGIETLSDYSVINCTEKGEWTIQYVCNNLITIKKFIVKDTKKPEISFSKIPYDLFIGETQTGDIPTFTVEDFSDIEIKKELKFIDKDGNEHNWDFNPMNGMYNINEAGVFNFIVTATDDSGNERVESVSWKVKDYTWKDNTLENGYLADFDEEGYYNLIRTGDINPYWNIKEYNEEYLDSYMGATGVMKIDVTYTGNNLNCIKFKLANPITIEELGDRYLAIRIYTDGVNLSDYLRFGGIQKIVENKTSSATVQRKLVKNQWSIYYLSATELKNQGFYSVADDPTSPITELQISFQRSQTVKYTTFYVDCITMAEKLPMIEDIVCEGKSISWDSIENSTAYKVTENGSPIIVNDKNYSLESDSAYVEVVAMGDSVLFIDSDPFGKIFGLLAEEGYVASFNNQLYTYLINGDINMGSETQGYIPRSVENEYIEEDKTFKSVIGAGSWGICTAVAVRFPQIVNIPQVGSKLLVKMKITAEGITKFTAKDVLFKYDLGNATIQDGMCVYEFTIPEKATSINGIEFAFVNRNGINTIEIILDSISLATHLSIPSLVYDKDNGVISWSPVEGATGYGVKLNDTDEVIVNAETLSYKYPEEKNGTIYIRAIGNGINYLDGEFAEIEYDSREILGEVTGFKFDKKTSKITWASMDNAVGYKVKIGENEVDTTQCEYLLTDMDYVEVSVKARGDGINYADGKYVLAYCGDNYLQDGYIADFGENYSSLFNTDVRLGGDESNLKSKELNFFYGEDGLVVSATRGSWGVTVSFRIKFPQAYVVGEQDEKLVLKMKVTGGESIKPFRLMNYSSSLDLCPSSEFKEMNTFANIIFTLKAGKTYEGIQFYCGTAVNMTFTFKYISKYIELDTPVLIETEDKIVWEAVDNAIAYDYIINDGETVRTTNTYYEFAEDEKGIISVKAIGNGENIASSQWSENIRYNYKGVILSAPNLRIENDEIVWDPIEKSIGYKVSINGEDSFIITENLYVYKGISIVNITVEALGDDEAYLTSDPSEIRVGKAGNNLVKVISDVQITGLSWDQDATHNQLEFNKSVWINSDFNVLGMKLTVNGEEFNGLSVTYGNESKLMFSGAFPTTVSEEYPIPVIKIAKDSLLVQNCNAYRISEDFYLVYVSATNKWARAKVTKSSSVSWTESVTSIQIKMITDVWKTNGSVNTAGMKILSNGNLLQITATADSAAHIHIKGNFATVADNSNGYLLPTLQIKEGSIAIQDNLRAIIFVEDETFILTTSNSWTLQNNYKRTDIKLSWSENAQSIQFVFLGEELFNKDKTVNNKSGIKIKFNGEYVDSTMLDIVLVTDTGKNFYIKGTSELQLPTAGENGYDFPTIEIEEGSYICQQGGNGFVITNTILLQYNEVGWVTA